MRLDDFLSTVGIVKRRTIAKELSQNGMVEINGHRAKPAHTVKAKDIIMIKGTNGASFEVLEIPTGSVSKESRAEYIKEIT